MKQKLEELQIEIARVTASICKFNFHIEPNLGRWLKYREALKRLDAAEKELRRILYIHSGGNCGRVRRSKRK